MAFPNLKNFITSAKALFVIALAARLAVAGLLLAHFGPGSFYLANNRAALSDNDSQNYVTIAKNLVEHGEYSRFAQPPYFQDAFRTPLLPVYFTPFVAAFGFTNGITVAMFILIIILSFTAVLGYKFARLFLDHNYAYASGLVLALEPLLVYRSSIAEPDALIVLLFLAAMYYFARYWREGTGKFLFLTGLFMGLMTLAKPVGIYAGYLLGLAALWKNKSIKHAAVYAFVIFLMLFPWLYRNHEVFGRWSLSSVTMYNFYNYYTAKLAPVETWPLSVTASRDPMRDLRNESYFLRQSLERIKTQPAEYAKQHLTGTVKNLLASDLPGIYNNGHAWLVPFAYNPKDQLAHPSLIYIVEHLLIIIGYLVIIYHWLRLYSRDKNLFALFTIFLALSFYFVFTAGTFVDAKYRLPAVPLLLIIFLHFWQTRRAAT